MKKKIMGILVCTLAIFATVSSVAGTMNIDGEGEVNGKNTGDSHDYKLLHAPPLWIQSFVVDEDWNYWSNPPHMFAMPTGSVGIGITNPDLFGKLAVAGTFYGGTGGGGYGIKIDRTQISPHISPAGGPITEADLKLVTFFEGDIILDTRGGEMRITDGGNVGIGIEEPEEKLHIIGNILKDGGFCAFAEDHPYEHTKDIVYISLEGPEAGTYIRGTAELVNGEAVINLPEHFSMVTSEEGLTVQLTPVGKWLQLYVVKKSTNQIIVHEANGESGQFHYLIQGVRKGYEDHQVIQEKED